jgi:hypothetical protein
MGAPAAAPHQRGQAGLELLDGEGLGQEIVGPDVQALDPVLQRALGGQHQHRGAVAGLADIGQQVEPVLVGQPQVEHHGVIVVAGQQRLGGAGIRRMVGHKAALLESAQQPRSHLGFVFHKQQAHGGVSGWRMCGGHWMSPRHRYFIST